jgi:Alkylmercury lyase
VVDERDLRLRDITYRLFVELGRAPTPQEVADAAGWQRDLVVAGWRRLHDAHALVLQPGNDAIRMANPFSAVPTPFRVLASDRWWYANCAWDAFGICAALACGGRIETTCPDCDDPIEIDVTDAMPDVTPHSTTDDQMLLFHSLVPAANWWDDIVFT